MDMKTIPVKRTRILVDGTKKSYMTKATYKVKNGVDDLRKEGKRRGTEKITPEQKQEMWELYLGGTQVKALCEKYNIAYITATKYIDGKKLELLETIKKSKQVNNV